MKAIILVLPYYINLHPHQVSLLRRPILPTRVEQNKDISSRRVFVSINLLAIEILEF